MASILVFFFGKYIHSKSTLNGKSPPPFRGVTGRIHSWFAIGLQEMCCYRYKAGMVGSLQMHWAERNRLAELLSQQAQIAAASAADAPSDAGGGVSACADLSEQPSVVAAPEPEFGIGRSAPPAPVPPVLAGIRQLNAQGGDLEVAVVRGVCDGCGQNVMSNDEGRQREDDKYYHSQCIKGLCGGCGRVVHADHLRMKLSGVYWHNRCMPGV
jgi:hypothetical protein